MIVDVGCVKRQVAPENDVELRPVVRLALVQPEGGDEDGEDANDSDDIVLFQR